MVSRNEGRKQQSLIVLQQTWHGCNVSPISSTWVVIRWWWPPTGLNNLVKWQLAPPPGTAEGGALANRDQAEAPVQIWGKKL